jgi:hypothetical protein
MSLANIEMESERCTLDIEPVKPWYSRRLLLLAFLSCSCGFLYLETFVLPNIPWAPAGDQSIYLQHGTKMLQGQLIYRDYDHFTLPGTDLLYLCLFRLFSVRVWIPQGMLVLLGLGISWLIIAISRKVLTGPVVFLPALLFLTLPFSGYLNATHHWYSTIAATAALAIVMDSRSVVRVAVAGALWGIATCFTQSVALGVLGLAAFLVWEHAQDESRVLMFKKQAVLFASFFAVLLAFNAYFIWQAGLKDFLYYTVVFVAKYFPSDWFNTWRVYLHGWHALLDNRANWPDIPTYLFIHALIPGIYVWFFLRYRHERRLHRDESWNRIVLLNVTGIALFLSVAAAPAYNRLCTVSVPAIITLVWLATRLPRTGPKFVAALAATALALACLKPVVTQTRWRACLDLPAGRTAFLDVAQYEETKWVAEREHPSDYFFGDQLICFLLTLRNPARIPSLRPTDYTRPEEVQNLVQALEEHKVNLISWYPALDTTHAHDNLAAVRLYLLNHYHVEKTFSNGYKIWARNESASLEMH